MSSIDIMSDETVCRKCGKKKGHASHEGTYLGDDSKTWVRAACEFMPKEIQSIQYIHEDHPSPLGNELIAVIEAAGMDPFIHDGCGIFARFVGVDHGGPWPYGMLMVFDCWNGNAWRFFKYRGRSRD